MKTFIKVVVSLVLIGLLLYNVEWEPFFDHVKSMSVVSLAIVLAIFIVQFPISAMKWKISLKIHQLSYSFGYLQNIICIGFFFNNFLPTSIGGDAYRVLKTMPKEGFRSRAVSAVLLERILGFIALLFLGFIGGVLILFQDYNQLLLIQDYNQLLVLRDQNQLIFYYVLFCIAGGVGAISLLFLFWLGVFSTVIQRLKKIKKLEILTHNIGHIWRTPFLLIKISFASLLFQALAIVAISVLFQALGSGDDYAKYAIMTAIVGLASMLPISINGIGVVEGAFVFSATQLGIGYDEALIAAFMMRILVVPLSLICGLVYLWDSRKK